MRRSAPGSSRGAPVPRQARRAAPRRNPAPERRSALAGPAPDGHHRRDAPEPARRACRQRTRPWPADAAPGSGSDPKNGQRGLTTCKCSNSHGQICSSRRARWLPGGKSHGTDDRGICAGDRADQPRFSAWNPVSCQQPRPGTCPIRTHVRRSSWPPLLYFPAVLAVRSVRISLPTCGAKRARTADLLHAIWRQHVHARPSVQVTVHPRPRKSAPVRVSCCTSVLYRCHPRRRHQPWPKQGPDQHQRSTQRVQVRRRRTSGQEAPKPGPRNLPPRLPTQAVADEHLPLCERELNVVPARHMGPP